MVELSPLQTKILEELFAAGFRPVAIPPYENALCVRRVRIASSSCIAENPRAMTAYARLCGDARRSARPGKDLRRAVS